MTRGRSVAWFSAAVIASFAAGVSVGLAAPRAIEAFAADEDRPHDAYVEELARRYGLDQEQVRLVRMVLESRDRELAAIEADPRHGEAGALATNLRAQERIKYVLNERQRARFLQDSELAGPPSGASAPDGEDASRTDQNGNR